jgi:hypothetical protein
VSQKHTTYHCIYISSCFQVMRTPDGWYKSVESSFEWRPYRLKQMLCIVCEFASAFMLHWLAISLFVIYRAPTPDITCASWAGWETIQPVSGSQSFCMHNIVSYSLLLASTLPREPHHMLCQHVPAVACHAKCLYSAYVV